VADPGISYPPLIIESDYVLSFSEPFLARYWFPCFDEPSDKAEEGVEFEITVPKGFYAAANGLLVSRTEKDGKEVFLWRHKFPIVTYLIALTVARFQVIEDDCDGLPLRYYVEASYRQSAEYDFGRTGEMVKYFSKMFGDYAFEKYGVAVVPFFNSAMEHQTMTTYSASLVTGDRRYERVVAHELAHHWWGDAVTMADFKDIWLNEGFASYCEALWAEHLTGAEGRDGVIRNFKERYFADHAKRRYPV